MRKQILFFFCLLLYCFGNSQTQPAQPATGYGGIAHAYDSVIVFNCDDGVTGFMLYIPSAPHADSLPFLVFDHGFGEWNPLSYGSWLNHLIKRGNIVVFPRYQLNEYTTLPSSFTPNAVAGILRAIDTIKAHPKWTQPELDNTFYLGHSYGGLISANLATQYATYGIPKPKGLLMACPGYGPYPGGELSSYAAMDSSIFVEDIFERTDSVVDSVFALQVFNQTTAVPYAHKNLVIHFADSTGKPPIVSDHEQPSCNDSVYDNGDRGIVMSQLHYAATDATDFYCYWKLFDALEDCALTGGGCTTAFGDTYSQKFMGLWSNGQPVVPLEVRPVAVAGITTLQNQTADAEVYPNPGNGVFQLRITNYELGINNTVEIYNEPGEKIYSSGNYQTTKSSNYQIDLTGHPSGIYLYRVISINGEQLATGKLVVE